MNTSTPYGSRPRIGVLLRGAGAALVIIVLTAGVPWLLLATVGNPLPSHGWNWDQPLTNDAVLGVLAVIAWLFWAQLTCCLVIETIAEVRIAVGRSADWVADVPGTLPGQQHLARVLVQAIVAAGVGTALLPGPPSSETARSAAVATVAHQAPIPEAEPASATNDSSPSASTRDAPAPSRSDHSPRRAAATVEVSKGDTLWSIAERHLGSGERWRQIADLNAGRLMPDGQRFAQASSIQPGWQLLIPIPADTGTRAAGEQVTLEPGDSLWQVAKEQYGDGDAWPRVYRANRDQINDPDLVFPGQTLDIPHRRAPRTPEPEPGHPRADVENRATTPASPPHGPPFESPPSVPADPPPTPDPISPHPPPRTAAPTSTQQPAQNTAGTSPAVDEDRGLSAALAGGGGLLAAGALAALMARRHRQFRNRRSGRTIAATPPALVPAEATIRSSGSAGGDAAAFLDRALRDLSSRLADTRDPLPNVAAVRLTDQQIDLILATPAANAPPEPWKTNPLADRWTLARDAPITDTAALAPYPALVAVGTSEGDGATWLLDLEGAGVLQINGDKTAAQNLARFVGAELALNTWSDDVHLTVTDLCRELVALNPERVSYSHEPDIDALTKTARRAHEGAQAMGCDILAGRRDGVGGDTWMPTVHIVEAGQTPARLVDDLGRLLDELALPPGRSTVAAVTTGDLPPLSSALTLTIDNERRIRLPWGDVHVIANQLTLTDAHLIGDLFEAADHDDDQPMPPATGTKPHEPVSDAAGAIRVELTETRDIQGSPESLLPLADRAYLDAGTTTAEDLATLAPNVPAKSASGTHLPIDPSLDEDLAAWHDPSTPHPRLRLLGPIEVTASGEPTPEVHRRRAYFTEIVAYLATRDHGATPEQVADAFHVQTNTIHSRVGTIRKWFGTNPTTGEWYLPESTRAPAARVRGIPVYEVVGLLTDADLFKRLRVRGQSRGPEGVNDLISALRLVAGRPFEQGRREGYGWLAETPLDHYLTAGIVDVAHIIATHALSADDTELAQWASRTAITAAPAEDKPRLDLAAAMARKGQPHELRTHVATQVADRSDDGASPALSSRTAEVLTEKGWLNG